MFWVSSCLQQFRWGFYWGGAEWSSLLSYIRVSPFSGCIYSFPLQVCSVWRWFFKPRTVYAIKIRRFFVCYLFKCCLSEKYTPCRGVFLPQSIHNLENSQHCSYADYRKCPRGVMVKAMDCRIVVSQFVFQSRYYVHFRTNIPGKGMKPLSFQLWVK